MSRAPRVSKGNVFSPDRELSPVSGRGGRGSEGLQRAVSAAVCPEGPLRSVSRLRETPQLPGIKSTYVHMLLTTSRTEPCFIHATPSRAPLFVKLEGTWVFFFPSFFFKETKIIEAEKEELLEAPLFEQDGVSGSF